MCPLVCSDFPAPLSLSLSFHTDCCCCRFAVVVCVRPLISIVYFEATPAMLNCNGMETLWQPQRFQCNSIALRQQLQSRPRLQLLPSSSSSSDAAAAAAAKLPTQSGVCQRLCVLRLCNEATPRREERSGVHRNETKHKRNVTQTVT